MIRALEDNGLDVRLQFRKALRRNARGAGPGVRRAPLEPREGLACA